MDISNINFETLIFDLDGVLIDVSQSYQVLPIIVTKKFYNEILELKNIEIKTNHENITYLKNIGGFNNDWDITYFFVDLIFNFVFPTVELKEDKKLKQKVNYIKEVIASEQIKVNEVDLKNLLRENMGGIKINNRFKFSKWCGADNEDIRENMIKRLFQEMYLGRDNLKKNYNLEPLFYKGEGYILKEKLLVGKKIIKNLFNRYMIAIATGRDRVDTDLCLKIQTLDKFFKVRITDDDVVKMEAHNGVNNSLRKPHPFMVEKAIHDLGSQSKNILYIGDNLDDIKAANALKDKYNIFSAGVLYEASDREDKEKLFNKLGVDVIFYKPQDLLKI